MKRQTSKNIIIVIFLHGLGRLTCSGIDASPSFPGASTISSSSRFVVEGVFRESGVVHSFKMVDQFCLCLSLTSCIPEISSSLLMTSLLVLSDFSSYILSRIFLPVSICTLVFLYRLLITLIKG